MRIKFIILTIISLSVLFGQVNFQKRTITTVSSGRVYSVKAGDLDGDGDNDILGTSDYDDLVAWYKNDGSGNFGFNNFGTNNISTSVDNPMSVFGVDLDGDNDMDVISASTNDDKISWFKNNGSESFTQITINTSIDQPYNVFAFDIDADGDIDIAAISASSANGYKLAWYENDGSENFTLHIINSIHKNNGDQNIIITDLDGDNDGDIITSTVGNGVEWYEYTGSGNFSTHTINTTFAYNNTIQVDVADIDGDNDIDIIATGMKGLNWYQNDGSENFTEKIIYSSDVNQSAITIADFDNDDDLDIASSLEYNGFDIFINDGTEIFTRTRIDIDKDIRTIQSADFDGDGDIDIVTGSRGPNGGGKGTIDVWDNQFIYNYSDKYATFTSPSCGDTLTIGQTYKIKWRTNVDPNVVTGTGTYDKVYLYIFSDGVSGKYCDGDAHMYGYNVSAGRLSIRDDSSVDLTGSSTMTNNAANGTAEFEWTVPASLQDYAGNKYFVIKFLSDQGQNSAYLNNISFVLAKDETAPTVTSVSSTADNGTYGIGSVIPITVTFDESVIVTGTPQLTLETGDTDAVVDYSSGSGSSILTFNYTVASGHISNDLEVPNENALVLNGGTIKDAVGNDATLTFPVADCCIGINKNIVIDGIVPVIVSTTNFNNVYAQMKFSEGIYNTNGGTGGVEKEDFNITLTQNGGTTTGAIISSILSSTGTAPAGGDTIINFNLDLTGTPSGVETIAITPVENSVFDVAGNDASTTQSNNSVTLNDKNLPSISSISISSDNSTVSVTFSEAVYRTYPITSQEIDNTDFTLALNSSASTTLSGPPPHIPGTIAADGNTYSLGILYSTPSLGGDTLYVRYNDNSIYDAAGNVAEYIANDIRYYVILNDVVPPVISSTTPNYNSYVNHSKVSYTLDETVASGTVTWTRTGGSEDSNSPHVQSLSGDELNAGAHTDITLTNNPTLVEGAIYTISFDAKDAAGNSATTVSVTNITYDVSAPTISSISPAASSYVNHVRVSYTLSEAISSGTVIWTRTGGSEDSSSPHAKDLTGDELNTGAHTDITLTNSPTLIDGAIYTVSFGATDLAGNSATIVSSTGINYDVTAPTISSTAPSQDSYVNNTKVSYTLSEAAASGTITWTRSGGSEDQKVIHSQALTGDELNSGPHMEITLTNNPALVDGTIYHISYDAKDAAGNEAESVSIINVTYDVTAPAIAKITPASDSFLPITDNSKIRIDFTEPITAYNIDIASKLGANLNTSSQQASDSLVISVNAPLTSLDSLTFTITEITDRAGSVGDTILDFIRKS